MKRNQQTQACNSLHQEKYRTLGDFRGPSGNTPLLGENVAGTLPQKIGGKKPTKMAVSWAPVDAAVRTGRWSLGLCLCGAQLRVHSALTFSRLLHGRIPGVENESQRETATLENRCVLPLWWWPASPVRPADSISATLLKHFTQIDSNGDNLEFILSGVRFWVLHRDAAEKNSFCG